MSITSAPANGARDASAARVTRHWVVCLLPSHTPRSLSSYRRVCLRSVGHSEHTTDLAIWKPSRSKVCESQDGDSHKHAHIAGH